MDKNKRFINFVKDIKIEVKKVIAGYSAMFKYNPLYHFMKQNISVNEALARITEFGEILAAAKVLKGVFNGNEAVYDRMLLSKM
jgi:hypothetical protein